MNPYELLSELVLIKPMVNNASPRNFHQTPRLDFITNKLIEIGLEPRFSDFNHYYLGGNLRNVWGSLGIDNNRDTIIFLAHHDVVNLNSQNAQDNSASICNLLALASSIDWGTLNKNIVFYFTDNEEFGGSGAGKLSEEIKSGIFGSNVVVLNFELTGLGNKIFCDGKLPYMETHPFSDLIDYLNESFDDEVYFKMTPFNDSVILRSNGIVSVCLGILPENELKDDYPYTWRLCHTLQDSINGCSDEDMNNFVNLLKKLI
jgi:hypothetical protein